MTFRASGSGSGSGAGGGGGDGKGVARRLPVIKRLGDESQEARGWGA